MHLVTLLPLRLAASILRLPLAIIGKLLGGRILGCLAPLGLLGLLMVAALAILIF